MPNGARPPGCGLQGPPSRASVVHRQLLLLCHASPPPGEAAPHPPPPAPTAPCVLAALHPHATVTATHSTGQAHWTVGFEPSSGSPSATGQLPCGGAAAPAMGRDPSTRPAWAGRHMLLGEAHALWSHGGCRQDPPSAQSLTAGSGRQPVASLAQAQFCTPALPGPRRTAPGRGDPSIIRDRGAPLPTVPGTGSGWQGGRGGRQRKQGAQGQGRDGRPPCRPFRHPQSAHLAEAPGDEAPVLAHSQGQGAWERPLGLGARRAAQHKLSFVLTDASAHSQGVPQPAPWPTVSL